MGVDLQTHSSPNLTNWPSKLEVDGERMPFQHAVEFKYWFNGSKNYPPNITEQCWRMIWLVAINTNTQKRIYKPMKFSVNILTQRNSLLRIKSVN